MRKSVILVTLVILTALPFRSYAHINWDGSYGATPSIPPDILRPALPAHVVSPRKAHADIHMDYLSSQDSGRTGTYPYDPNNTTGGYGVLFRKGFGEGFEFGSGVDYPFFVPSAFFRYQPLGWENSKGFFATLEAGLDLMPDRYAGLALGLGVSEKCELWSAYRGGWVLDRGYSEVGGGISLKASEILAMGFGVAWRRFDTLDHEQMLRASLNLDFGSQVKPVF